MKVNAVTLTKEEYMLSGNRACAGCGLGLVYRTCLKALGPKTVIIVPAGCATVLHGMYPITSVNMPCINVAFPSTAASATGAAAAFQALGKKDYNVVAFAGDGATYDIGMGGLSGAAERNADFIYICYDNEAYMNTGTQRSSATPIGATTTTTPYKGKQQNAKDMPMIMEAHHIPYIATANAAYPLDLYEKVSRAKEIHGTRYVQIFTPCPPGWVYPSNYTVKMGRMAVEAGVSVLFEIENGILKLSTESERIALKGSRKPIDEYLKMQGRFKNISQEQRAEYQQWVDTRWDDIVKRANLGDKSQ